MKLINERIYLRPVKAEDAQLFLDHTEDEEIRYMTGTKARFSLEQIQDHIEQIQQDDTRYDFTICLYVTDQLIGELSVLDIDQGNQSAGFRITMNAMALTGKGYGTEAIKLELKFVFDVLKLNRLQLEVFSHNERGIRAYEKNGFKREGVLRVVLHYNGAFSDEIIMAIIRSDYQKAKARKAAEAFLFFMDKNPVKLSGCIFSVTGLYYVRHQLMRGQLIFLKTIRIEKGAIYHEHTTKQKNQ